MKRFLLPLAIALCYFSCGEKGTDSLNTSADFHLEIVDSMRIDYLGNLWVLDYDSSSRSYLAWGNRDKEVLILDSKGKVTSTFDFPSDGPDALQGWINPIGLRDGNIEFNVTNQGFFRYDFQGNRMWKHDLPFDYFYVNGLNGDAFYPLREEIAFLRPEHTEHARDKSMKNLFEGIYGEPILEVIDTVSNVSRVTMPFPPNSMYTDGNFYFWMYPTVIRSESEWLLYFRNELKFWVYREEDGEVNFQREVSLEVSDGVKAIGVPFEKEEEYSMATENNFPGTIQEVYRSKDKTIVIYSKGVKEELAQQYDRNEPEGRRELEKLKKNYVAVFDAEFNLLQNDIPVPQGLIFTTILTEDDEILALKHPDFFETEDDFVIYYKLKVLN